MHPIEAEDSKEYFRYTNPSRLDKAMHTLEGIVRGISLDGRVNTEELATLVAWISEFQEFARRHPFNEVIPRLNRIVNDPHLSDEEIADVLWLCNKFTTQSDYYDEVSSDMQRLQGMLGGIISDGAITKNELLELEKWMEEREHLQRCWPYDEIESLIVTVLADGVIDEHEHEMLMRFFSEFTQINQEKTVDPLVISERDAVTGVCSMCPDVEFEGRTFCFTGASHISTRNELAKLVSELGGNHSEGLTKKVDYLVVCSEGNQCWAYACYGRKVEKAIAMRKEGSKVILVHETDFRDALPE